MNALVVRDDIQDFIKSELFTGRVPYPPTPYKKWFGFLYVAKAEGDENTWKVGMTNYIKDRTKALAREKVKPPVYVWSCPNVQVIETAVKQVLVHFTAAGGDEKAEDKLEALADEDNGAAIKGKYKSEIFSLPFPVLIRMIRLIVLYVYTREQWITSNFHYQTLHKYFQLKPEGIRYVDDDGEKRTAAGTKVIDTRVTVRYPNEEEVKIKWQLKQIGELKATNANDTGELKKALRTEQGLLEEEDVPGNRVELLRRLAEIVYRRNVDKSEPQQKRLFKAATGLNLPVPTVDKLRDYAKSLYIDPEWYGKTYQGIVRSKSSNNRYKVYFYIDNKATTAFVYPEFIIPDNSFDLEAVYAECNIKWIEKLIPQDEDIQRLDLIDFGDINFGEERGGQGDDIPVLSSEDEDEDMEETKLKF